MTNWLSLAIPCPLLAFCSAFSVCLPQFPYGHTSFSPSIGVGCLTCLHNAPLPRVYSATYQTFLRFLNWALFAFEALSFKCVFNTLEQFCIHILGRTFRLKTSKLCILSHLTYFSSDTQLSSKSGFLFLNAMCSCVLSERHEQFRSLSDSCGFFFLEHPN